MAKTIYWYEHRFKKKTENDFLNEDLSWWIMQSLVKLLKVWENIEKLKLSQKRRKYLVSEKNHHTTKFFK